MTTLRGTASASSQGSEHLTLRWLARRSALMVLILAGGIGAACYLYAVADEGTAAPSSPPETTASIPHKS